MSSFIDVLIITWLSYAVWKSFRQGYVKAWLAFGYNVLGWGAASIYATTIARSSMLRSMNTILLSLLPNSQLEITVSAYSASLAPGTNLPPRINELLTNQLEIITSNPQVMLTTVEGLVVNLLISLTCYLLIWLAVRGVFAIADILIIRNSQFNQHTNSVVNLIPAFGNALLCAMLLSGIIWPFAIIFDRIGLAGLWSNSFVLRAMANLFYKIQIGWLL